MRCFGERTLSKNAVVCKSLERIDWEEWFRQFDANGLVFLHRDIKHRDGSLDRFNKLVRRE